jgi:hypothetical protein
MEVKWIQIIYYIAIDIHKLYAADMRVIVLKVSIVRLNFIRPTHGRYRTRSRIACSLVCASEPALDPSQGFATPAFTFTSPGGCKVYSYSCCPAKKGRKVVIWKGTVSIRKTNRSIHHIPKLNIVQLVSVIIMNSPSCGKMNLTLLPANANTNLLYFTMN